jgi:hypothetical protein
MALQKLTPSAYGVDADYWRITSYSFNSYSLETYVRVDLFLNQEARNSGKMPVAGFDYTLPSELSRAQIYTYLKDNVEVFIDAIDV